MTLTKVLQRFLRAEPKPVTHKDVEPAARDPEKEAEVKAALNDLTHAVLRANNRSVYLRQRLAGEAIRIVAGD